MNCGRLGFHTRATTDAKSFQQNRIGRKPLPIVGREELLNDNAIRIDDIRTGIRDAVPHAVFRMFGIADAKRVDNFRVGIGQQRKADSAVSFAEVLQYLDAVIADGHNTEARRGQLVER